MNKSASYIFKGKCILTTSVVLLCISIALLTGNILSYDNNFEFTTINVSQMATASVAKKEGSVDTKRKLIEVEIEDTKKENEKATVTNISVKENTRVWYLPTEYGTITTYPNYYHVAYDITSPRGSAEIIYPVASGIISGIYTDNAGAKIVTVRHIIDGRYYSSQYAHLSNYADIYVGKEVTPFTPLGWMGTTGMSTGVHLHIAVADCNMFGNNDVCSDLNGFFYHVKERYNSGFYGLGSVINVPYSWSSR